MYERFTDRSRRVMQLANREAQRFNHEYIGTEHILLGLVSEGSGVAANVLKNLNINLREVRRQVERIVQHGPGGDRVVEGRFPKTPRAKKVIEYAVEEAKRLKHNYIGTEHLLLGLLREEEGVAAQVLIYLGLKLDTVREEVTNLLGHAIPEVSQPIDPPTNVAPIIARPEPLTNELRSVIEARIQQLKAEKEERVVAQDFDRASRCREEAVALKQLLDWYDWFRQYP
jgi:ATP-dependent Clp protease ATP-binding subunit ClpA